VNDPRARAARPYTGRSDGVVSAGHGVHRSISRPNPIGVHLCSSAAKSASPAGHGVHRSFRDRFHSSTCLGVAKIAGGF
jgi:hypothetical protein